MIVMLDYADRLPRSAHMFSMVVAHLNSSMNPLLYALTNPLFQKGYGVFIRKLLCMPEAKENTMTTRTKQGSISYIKSTN